MGYFTVFVERTVNTVETFEWEGEAASQEEAEALALAEVKKRGFNGWDEDGQDIDGPDVVYVKHHES